MRLGFGLGVMVGDWPVAVVRWVGSAMRYFDRVRVRWGNGFPGARHTGLELGKVKDKGEHITEAMQSEEDKTTISFEECAATHDYERALSGKSVF